MATIPHRCVQRAKMEATWGPELPGAPVDCQSGGLSAHIIGAEMAISIEDRLVVTVLDIRCTKLKTGQ